MKNLNKITLIPDENYISTVMTETLANEPDLVEENGVKFNDYDEYVDGLINVAEDIINGKLSPVFNLPFNSRIKELEINHLIESGQIIKNNLSIEILTQNESG